MSRAREKARYVSMVADAAYLWWQHKRPKGWSKAQHTAEPTANCVGIQEDNLAMAVALMAKFRD
jgi:hypothetical protein